uniref:CSON007506 protein n=1 Tax=Culicoides sonorensis TaxID=179676 RepID=A0A336MV33_CULSO
MKSRKGKNVKGNNNKKDEIEIQLEIPEEYLKGIDENFKFECHPAWVQVDDICPALSPFQSDPDFQSKMENVTHSLRKHISENSSREVIQEAFKSLMELIISGKYDTEAKYVWLISCASRILLQKIRFSVNVLLESSIFSAYNSDSLFCPAKMHHISKELYQITKGNTLGIAHLVEKLFHLNSVLNYVCICLVSAGINRIYLKADPDIFQPLRPSDITNILKEVRMSQNVLNFTELNELLILLSLYNKLVVMNLSLNDIFPNDLVKYFCSGKSSYIETNKKWLTDASFYVGRAMKKLNTCPSLLKLQQQILFELQYGLGDLLSEVWHI